MSEVLYLTLLAEPVPCVVGALLLGFCVGAFVMLRTARSVIKAMLDE